MTEEEQMLMRIATLEENIQRFNEHVFARLNELSDRVRGQDVAIARLQNEVYALQCRGRPYG